MSGILFDQATDDVRYRTIGARGIAAVIDAIVLAPLMLLVHWAGGATGSPAALAMLYLFGAGSPFVYSIWLHGRYGRTLGKRAVSVRVLNVAEGPLSMRQAFLRDLPAILLAAVAAILVLQAIAAGGNPVAFGASNTMPEPLASAYGFWGLLEILTAATNRKRRAVHDWIAQSVVVNG